MNNRIPRNEALLRRRRDVALRDQADRVLAHRKDCKRPIEATVERGLAGDRTAGPCAASIAIAMAAIRDFSDSHYFRTARLKAFAHLVRMLAELRSTVLDQQKFVYALARLTETVPILSTGLPDWARDPASFDTTRSKNL